VEQHIQEKINKHKNISGSIFWVSLILGGVFWIIDAVLTIISPTNFSFLQALIGIDTRNIWQRLIVLCLFVIFASYVRYNVKKQHETDEKLRQTLESLNKAAGSTIQVLVSALESRDPFTAGHQARSANLACAIATEMGLSQEKIDGIRMAGSIHDIGKLSVPANILSKPAKLTNTELSLIKEHPRNGYEMLKDVESPWPLAETVFQHHERLDGSGYPRNLKGDEILIEARIMAVADAVEAIASHRPYRVSWGVEAALEEIEKNKGLLYDDAVVDACLKLFRDGYHLIIDKKPNHSE
jgi:HD-GYP domain-containing protein (c-di-GMP phosphodiesterase class II)